MKSLVFCIVFFSCFQASAFDKPAEPHLDCPEANNCKIRLAVKDKWKVYAHDESNPESLSLTVNKAQSENIESIKIDWSSQQVQSENIHGIQVSYYVPDSDININVIAEEAKYKLTLDLHYAACKDYCAVFQDQISFSTSHNHNIFHLLLLALVGGFILNFMPCVLPVVWLKAMHLSGKRTRHSKTIRKEISFIFLGVIIAFWGLALATILMRKLGHVVGWGFHFQEPIFVALLAAITGLGAMNLFGLYELHVPAFLQRILTRSSGKLLDFFHGVFLVLLATPCTAPFLGTAIAFCLSQSDIYIFLIYSLIAVGLALPYLMLALFPKSIKFLPKPGAWMSKLKALTAISFALVSLWMLYVLYEQDIYLGKALVVAALLVLTAHRAKVGLGVLGVLIVIYGANSLLYSKAKWGEFKIERIDDEIKLGRTVLVNITSDWCLTCKVNEKVVFDDTKVIAKLHEIGTVTIVGDYTKNSEEISRYIKQNNRSGIPLSVVYGPAAPQGIVLPVILTKNDLFCALEKARKT